MVTRLVRRSISVPAVIAILFVLTVASVVAVPVLAALDVVGRRRFARLRAYLLLWLYSACDTAGIVRCVVIWLRWSRSPERYYEENYRLEIWWGNALFRGAMRIFGIRLEVENPDLAEGGPVLVFPRHVSPVDNLLPLVVVSRPFGIKLRWVINRWLQRDPCIDIVGHRLPNIFVSTAGRWAGEAAGVADLGRDLKPDEGVLIFPEGALYTPQRREQLLARLRERGDHELAERACRITSMLPPRTGGVLGLLDAAPGADVLFIGHHGMEGATKYTSIAWGALVHARLRVRFWRVPASEIPKGQEARVAWLFDCWERMDRWVAEVEAERG